MVCFIALYFIIRNLIVIGFFCSEELREEHEREKVDLEEQFCERLQQVKEEFAIELTHASEELKNKHTKDLGKNFMVFSIIYHEPIDKTIFQFELESCRNKI